MELLLLSSLAIGALHALAPDHWLPFVALARTQQWSKLKTSYLEGEMSDIFFIEAG